MLERRTLWKSLEILTWAFLAETAARRSFGLIPAHSLLTLPEKRGLCTRGISDPGSRVGRRRLRERPQAGGPGRRALPGALSLEEKFLGGFSKTKILLPRDRSPMRRMIKILKKTNP